MFQNYFCYEQVLEVDGNRIEKFNELSVEFLINATNLTQLTLHKNPWNCDCASKDFVAITSRVSHLKKVMYADCEHFKLNYQ